MSTQKLHIASAPASSSVPTIEEVARLCGVSKSTVSKALNGQTRLVSKATREEILRTAESIGFMPNWRARVWVTRRSQMIAVLHSALNHSVPRSLYWELLDRLDELLSERGYSMIFVPARESYPGLDQMLGDGRFDGVICLGLIEPPILAKVRKRKLPSVLINVGVEDHWTRIAVDDAGGTRQVMQHLLSLGHKRIVFRSEVEGNHSSWRDRVATYQQCMADAGLKPYEIHVGPPAQFAQWLLGISSATRPTAVVDFAYWSAVTLLRTLWQAGLKVPDDVSVATFNNAYPVAETIPSLTTVAFPSVMMAELATRMIFEQIEGADSEPEAVTVPTHLVVRESTAAVGKTPARSATVSVLQSSL